MDAFVQWLYTKRIELPAPPSTFEDREYNLVQTAQLLMFADKYDISSMKVDIFVKLLEHPGIPYSKLPSVQTLEYVYRNKCGLGFRRLLGEWYAHDRQRSWFEKDITQEWLQQVPGFAIDLVAAFVKRGPYSDMPKNPQKYM